MLNQSRTKDCQRNTIIIQKEYKIIIIRFSAVKALGQIGSNSPEEIAALITVVTDRDEDPDVRRTAVEALGKIGPGSLLSSYSAAEKLRKILLQWQVS